MCVYECVNTVGPWEVKVMNSLATERIASQRTGSAIMRCERGCVSAKKNLPPLAAITVSPYAKGTDPGIRVRSIACHNQVAALRTNPSDEIGA